MSERKYLIVDGHNVLKIRNYHKNQWPLAEYPETMDFLVNQISEYSQSKGHYVTVVFDAGNREDCEREHRAGVEVVFVKKADPEIRDLAEQYGRDCVVVSSDRDIIQPAEAHGAFVMRSHEFQDKLRMAETRIRGAGKGSGPSGEDKPPEDDPPPRRPDKKGNPRKLPKAARRRNRRLKGL